MTLKEFKTKLLANAYRHAVFLNQKNIFELLEKNPHARMLDLGCDDGAFTQKIAHAINTRHIYGVDIVDEKIKSAMEKNITVKKNDLNNVFDFEDNSFDVLSANQVIEHIFNSDNFLSQLYRVLKPGGYAIISTENASSWCNIFASIMGWQIFSLTNISSKKQGIGNPLALHYGEPGSLLSSWNHVRIYNIRGLKEYLETFGFIIESIRGAGYFPLPSSWGNVDKTHAHFITFKIRKPQ